MSSIFRKDRMIAFLLSFTLIFAGACAGAGPSSSSQTQPAESTETVQEQPAESAETVQTQPAESTETVQTQPAESTETVQEQPAESTEMVQTQSAESAETVQETDGAEEFLSYEGYTLRKAVVLSRHNIRSPLTGEGSVLDTLTPHEWFAWSSDPSDLSLRGGVLETEMGQFFRKWAEREGLFPEDYQPADGEVRIYANSKQRTIATASFFQAGLIPVGDSDVEFHAEFDQMDPVFNPRLTNVTDEFKTAARKQMEELSEEKIQDLADNYELLADVIDLKESDDARSGKFGGFRTDDTEFILEENQEPQLSGSLKTGCSLSDALVLQYYETDEKSAAFGKELSDQQWEDIAQIKDVYQDALFTAPMIACNVAHPLLQEIQSELDAQGRRFTFLCGHDSNVGSVLAALQTQDYELDQALEKKTPIGCKLVFGCWENSDQEAFVSLHLVYQTLDQLREMALLDEKDPPAVMALRLQGLEPVSDGLYRASDLEQRLSEAIEAYAE